MQYDDADAHARRLSTGIRRFAVAGGGGPVRIAAMPLPRSLARFNRVVTNRLFAPLAGRVPPWVLVEHRGRRSGRVYRTVLMAFPRGHDLVVALTYGPNADWVRNVVAARSCRAKWAGRWRTFSRVEVVEGAAGLALVGPLLRVPLGVAGVTTVLHLRT